MRARDTRAALLQAGVDLFLQGGYDFAGTNAILEKARAPRGSFYHFFEDKQAFALAVAEYYYEQHLPALDDALGDDDVPPIARLRRYFEALRRDFRRAGWTSGCLLGMLGQELADRNDVTRSALAKLFSRWRHRLTDCLREAKERGELDALVDTEELAGFVLDAWEGALMQMKLKRSGAPLDAFLHVVFERLLAPRHD